MKLYALIAGLAVAVAATTSQAAVSLTLTGIVDQVDIVEISTGVWGFDITTSSTWDTMDGGFSVVGGSLATNFAGAFPNSTAAGFFPNDSRFTWHLDDEPAGVVSFGEIHSASEMSTDGATVLAITQASGSFAQLGFTGAPTFTVGLYSNDPSYLALLSNGQIVGTISGTFDSVGTATQSSGPAVPEPTMLLVFGGLAGVLGLRRSF